MRLYALIVTAMAALTASAGSSAPDDPRIHFLEFAPNQRYGLQILPRVGVIIAFIPDEHVRVVKLSAPEGYRVLVTPDGTSLSIQQVRPIEQVTMSVDTDLNHYAFDLSPSTTDAAPYFVSFRYSQSPDSPVVREVDPSEGLMRTSYKLSGAKELWPLSMSDDGRHTYVTWREDQALSAVFAEDRLGREQMVDGYMRDGIFTIDRVYDQLVFRIDKTVAKARRLTSRVSRDGK